MIELALVPPARAAVTPAERLAALFDPGSMQVMRSAARSRQAGARSAPGDGVLAASGTVGGATLLAYAQDAGVMGGSLGSAHADTIVRVLELAERTQAPVVALVSSAGARLQEGVDALAGYARIFRAQVGISGRVPQVTVVTGASAGGGSYSPALGDFVVMTRAATMFLTGPRIVAQTMGEDVDAHQLGGPHVHERNGVAHLVADDDLHALRQVRELLGFLRTERRAPADPEPGAPDAMVPADGRRVYDVRLLLARLLDRGELLEIQPRWARNVAIGFGRIDGRRVGVVASQPRHLGGVLDADTAQKAARFVRTCNSFGVPLLVVVDTPGFLPGTHQEAHGVIRHGAKLLHAFAEARVPKITLVVRKAFGGAYISMNSKDLGADLVFAWPQAQIGVMGGAAAAGLIHRRAIEAATDPAAEHERRAHAYSDEHLRAAVAAAHGHVDEVIHPSETRRRLSDGFAALECARPTSDHVRNIPL